MAKRRKKRKWLGGREIRQSAEENIGGEIKRRNEKWRSVIISQAISGMAAKKSEWHGGARKWQRSERWRRRRAAISKRNESVNREMAKKIISSQ